MHDRWYAALEAFGQALLDLENAIESDPRAIPPFTYRFPADLGPLPHELGEIAESLYARAMELQERIRAMQDLVRAEHAAVLRARRATKPNQPAPHYVDIQS